MSTCTLAACPNVLSTSILARCRNVTSADIIVCSLKIYKDRYHTSNFFVELEKFYDRRINRLKQRGFLKELGVYKDIGKTN